MEIAKVEFGAVAEVVNGGELDLFVLTDLQLALVGGGQGDVVLG